MEAEYRNILPEMDVEVIDATLIEKLGAFFTYKFRSPEYAETAETAGRNDEIVDRIAQFTRHSEEVAWLVGIVGVKWRGMWRMKCVKRVTHGHELCKTHDERSRPQHICSLWQMFHELRADPSFVDQNGAVRVRL